ncbi:MAG: polysaccharide pyruvyl transferase family protein, partial [Eubacterium sp.]|nr:polysaccharide pyruvyl transferase family protein [Eubacterium sp.]
FFENSDIEVKVVKPTRPEPSTNLTWEERKAEVEQLLDLYQNSRGVITFRLHCSLPCLALEVPVLLVRPSFESVRFSPYKDYLNTATPSDILGGKLDKWLENPAPNPEAYKEVRESLSKIVSDFIEAAKAETRKASELVRTSYTDDEVMRWQHDTMKKTLHNYHIEHHIDLAERNKLKKDVERLNKQVEKLNNKLDKKQAKIDEFKSYSFLRMIRLAIGRLKIVRAIRHKPK